VREKKLLGGTRRDATCKSKQLQQGTVEKDANVEITSHKSLSEKANTSGKCIRSKMKVLRVKIPGRSQSAAALTTRWTYIQSRTCQYGRAVE
jgi:hypothetical protein